MQPRIELLLPKKLIGKRMNMSLAGNKTGELWRSFMPARREIKNNISADLISMRVYDPSYNFENFDLNAVFEKWATAEVKDFDHVAAGMETFELPGGLYAVFLYKGAASAGAPFFQYIFGTWLPGSEYELDNRPHFELLGEKYKNEDPNSEEEIFIPVKKKA